VPFVRYASRQTDRQTDRQHTHRNISPMSRGGASNENSFNGRVDNMIVSRDCVSQTNALGSFS